MNETLPLRELGGGLRRLWWLPVLLILLGAGAAVVASASLAPLHRAQGTILVGATDGAVTRSTSIRASESQAAFYADLARRQIVLEPVARKLGLGTGWPDLRSQVSAAVPTENPRLLVVTVSAPTQEEAQRIARAVVQQVVSFSPGGTNEDQRFLNEQTEMFKRKIESGERMIDELRAELSAATSGEASRRLTTRIAQQNAQLDEWRRTYVALISAEPESDAGALRVLDEVTAVEGTGRPGTALQALIGGSVGGVLGLLLVQLLRGRRRGPAGPDRSAIEPTRPGADAPQYAGPGIRTVGAASVRTAALRDSIGGRP